MKRILPLLLCLLLLTGCGGNDANGSYEQITQEVAKEMMDTQEVIILDVREQDEYDSENATASWCPAWPARRRTETATKSFQGTGDTAAANWPD